MWKTVVIPILLYFTAMPLVAEINYGFDYNYPSDCTKRNSNILGKALIDRFGDDKIAHWINNDVSVKLTINIDSTGCILKILKVRFFDKENITKPYEKRIIYDYFLMSDLKFSICIEYDHNIRQYPDTLDISGFRKHNEHTITVTFPGYMGLRYNDMTPETRYQKYIEHINHFGVLDNYLTNYQQKSDIRKSHKNNCGIYNSAQLFVSLLYQCGEYTISNRMKSGSTYRLRLRLADDGTVKQIIRIDTNRNDVPINLKEVLMDYWKFDGTTFRYDCGSSPDGNDHIVTVDFPGRLLDFNKDEPIFKRALYNAVLILNPDIK